MAAPVRYIPLISLAPLYAAFDVAPEGGMWKIVATQYQDETGSASCQLAVISGKHTDILVFRGPTTVGLGSTQLEHERERLRRIRDEADKALKDLDAHIEYRKKL